MPAALLWKCCIVRYSERMTFPSFMMRSHSCVRVVQGLLCAGVCALASTPALAADAAASRALLGTTVKETAQERLRHALDQFGNWAAWLELVLGVSLAVGLATVLAYHPRTTTRRDLVEASEERKTLVILGVIGAVVSALVVIDQSMALVIFGIGSLIRFRTVIGNPHMTGRAILVVVIGLACGLSQFVTAIVIAAAAWVVIWWLHARRAACIKVRVPAGADGTRAQLLAAESLRQLKCRVQSQRSGTSGRTTTFVALVPAAMADEALIESLKSRLLHEVGQVEVELRRD